MEILRIENLCKYYTIGDMTLKVLKDINLTVTQGEYLAIMGPSGSGKSTMLNQLGCLDKPTSGNYFLGDQDVALLDDDTLSAIRGQRIGFVFQSYNLIAQLNVVENIQVPMYYQGVAEPESIRRATEMAQLVGLGDRQGHLPFEMSGGQQQRVGIARALVNNPLIVLADEPTGNLDSQSGGEILDILDGLQEQGKTLIIVTHDDNIARRASRIIHMYDGVIDRIEVKGDG
jgi:putative ABC transport system ATP-binding protein